MIVPRPLHSYYWDLLIIKTKLLCNTTLWRRDTLPHSQIPMSVSFTEYGHIRTVEKS